MYKLAAFELDQPGRNANDDTMTPKLWKQRPRCKNERRHTSFKAM